MSVINVAGATVIQAQAGDRITFVVNHSDLPEDALAQLQELFPGLTVQIVMGCTEVIHEPQTQHLSVSGPT